MVVSAYDTLADERRAIKKVTPFEHHTFSQRTLREMKILRGFSHPNIVEMVDLFVGPPGAADVKDVYMVLHLMETDLHQVLKSLKHRGDTLSNTHACFFTYQMLLAVKYIHSANVLHRGRHGHHRKISTPNQLLTSDAVVVSTSFFHGHVCVHPMPSSLGIVGLVCKC